MGILDYFDRLAIIHLPARVDRFRALRRELSNIGIDIDDAKVRLPDPPMPETANGFSSRGVYGSFLSHLEIIEQAYHDGLETVWILEDDAIFSRRFKKQQSSIAASLQANPWDMCFIGHSVWKELPYSPTGFLRFSGPFIWAHSYAVHRRIMPHLIKFLRSTLEREPGHPEGGRLYIDAAYFFYRQFYPEMICVVSSPCLSVQKGSRSSLGAGSRFEKSSVTRFLLNVARGLRDECWRWGWWRIDGPQHELAADFALRTTQAQPWPPETSVQFRGQEQKTGV